MHTAGNASVPAAARAARAARAGCAKVEMINKTTGLLSAYVGRENESESGSLMEDARKGAFI